MSPEIPRGQSETVVETQPLFLVVEAPQRSEAEPVSLEKRPALARLREELTRRIELVRALPTKVEEPVKRKKHLPFKTALAVGSLAATTIACSAWTWFTATTPEASAIRAGIGAALVCGWFALNWLKSHPFGKVIQPSGREISREEKHQALREGWYAPDYAEIRTEKDLTGETLEKFIKLNTFIFAPILAGAAYVGYMSQPWGWAIGVGFTAATCLRAVTALTNRLGI